MTYEAYSVAEGIFPYWETVFALIVGQIFIAYYQTTSDQTPLAFLGFILALCWFFLVSLNYQNALHMGRKAEALEVWLNLELELNGALPVRRFLIAWPRSEDKAEWKWWRNIFCGLEPKKVPTLKPPSHYFESFSNLNKENEKDVNACIQRKVYRILSSFFEWLKSLIKASWFWRRILPFLLCVYWIVWGGVLDFALRSLVLYLPQK